MWLVLSWRAQWYDWNRFLESIATSWNCLNRRKLYIGIKRKFDSFSSSTVRQTNERNEWVGQNVFLYMRICSSLFCCFCSIILFDAFYSISSSFSTTILWIKYICVIFVRIKFKWCCQALLAIELNHNVNSLEISVELCEICI